MTDQALLKSAAVGRQSGEAAATLVQTYSETPGFDKVHEVTLAAEPAMAKAPRGAGGVNLGDFDL